MGSVPGLLELPEGCKFAPRCAYVIRECTEDEPALLAVNAAHRARCIRFDCVGDEAAKTHPERTGEGLIAAD
jgi:hypothetical protein